MGPAGAKGQSVLGTPSVSVKETPVLIGRWGSGSTFAETPTNSPPTEKTLTLKDDDPWLPQRRVHQGDCRHRSIHSSHPFSSQIKVAPLPCKCSTLVRDVLVVLRSRCCYGLRGSP
ncbi:hypothetical protein E2C01_067178 [Portunus trituberculatus]|uniref:Uncharacterized protein n=1 Tax=Portunus trituberculatus TaxID=210409 RepID=A0A5B7HWS5_PORTR|nr:hypothetical protein [Portunus trituberculatus]